MKRLTMYVDKHVFYSDNGNPILPVEMLETPLVREVLKKLAEYEDIELAPDVIKYKLNENEELKEKYSMLESGNKQLCEEIKRLVKEKGKLINALRYVKEQYEMDFTEEELAELEPRDESIYNTVVKNLNEIDI